MAAAAAAAADHTVVLRGLVREHLQRRGYADALRTFDAAHPRGAGDVTSSKQLCRLVGRDATEAHRARRKTLQAASVPGAKQASVLDTLCARLFFAAAGDDTSVDTVRSATAATETATMPQRARSRGHKSGRVNKHRLSASVENQLPSSSGLAGFDVVEVAESVAAPTRRPQTAPAASAGTMQRSDSMRLTVPTRGGWGMASSTTSARPPQSASVESHQQLPLDDLVEEDLDTFT